MNTFHFVQFTLTYFIAFGFCAEHSNTGTGNHQIIENKIEYIPGYDIEKEIWNIEQYDLRNEVPQEYEKYNVTILSKEVYNSDTKVNETKDFVHLDYIMPKLPKQPLPDVRDTHLPQIQSEDTRFWKQMLLDQRKLFKSQRYLFITGAKLKNILIHVFGATEQDLDDFENACDNLNHDPYIVDRKLSNYRMGFDFKIGVARRLLRSPFILTANDGFKRKADANTHRWFGETQDWVIQNSAFQALKRFEMFLIDDLKSEVIPRPNSDPLGNFNEMGFFVRTMGTPNIRGNPTREGVHQDGAEYAMVTLLKSRNVDWKNGSAKSRVMNGDQDIGVQYDDVDSDKILEEVQHNQFLDTIIVVDNEVKHVVSSIKPIDDSKVVHRDVHVSHVRRRFANNGDNVREYFDTEISHQEMPCAFEMRSKHLTQYYQTSV